MKKSVVLGVTSGIAAYKSVELTKMLVDENIEVQVVMTKIAEKMVDPKEFEKVSGNKTYKELFEKDFDYKNILKLRKVDHIDLADTAGVIVIAPATANIIAKLAYGIADDFLTTTVLAATSPIIICPSMNVHMWKNPITQENLEKLKKNGFIIIPPESGMLACGYEGPGRLPHLQKIKDEIMAQAYRSSSMSGKKILITAGGTTEAIDDARVLTNRSSGKMGIAIAEEAYLRGAEVVLLRASNSVEPRYHIKEEIFETTEELAELMKEYIFTSEIVFQVAAVSDFLPERQKGKLSSEKKQEISLNRTEKIISQIKIWNPKIILIGFKAISSSVEEELVKSGKAKREESNADAIIVNDISRSDSGFQADQNEVYIISKKEKIHKIPLASKRDVAKQIFAYLFDSAPKLSVSPQESKLS